MPRPRKIRKLSHSPDTTYFKPQGIPMKELQVINLSHEELEAIRLKYIEDLDQNACAEKMQTSQSTFQRILTSANKNIAKALVQGYAIKIIK